jgi:DNA invertase Pin-like site-specific DNA recombinase
MPRKLRRAPVAGFAISYARVSTTEQATEGVSLAAQHSGLTAYAAAHGLTLVQSIEDAGVSASVPLGERPGGAELVERLVSGEVGIVVAMKLDRLFRDALDALAVTRSWDDRKITLILVDQQINTSCAVGRLFITMLAGVAEMERNMIGERTAAALAHLKGQGVRVGRDGIGWTRTDEIDADGRRVVTELPEERALADRIREMRDEGLTFQQIADALTGECVPTKRGGRWHATTTRNVCVRSAPRIATGPQPSRGRA